MHGKFEKNYWPWKHEKKHPRKLHTLAIFWGACSAKKPISENDGLQILFFLGFKTQVFNFQFLTRPDILFSSFPHFWTEKGYFLLYFNRPTNSRFESNSVLEMETPHMISPILTWGTLLKFHQFTSSNGLFKTILLPVGPLGKILIKLNFFILKKSLIIFGL